MAIDFLKGRTPKRPSRFISFKLNVFVVYIQIKWEEKKRIQETFEEAFLGHGECDDF